MDGDHSGEEMNGWASSACRRRGDTTVKELPKRGIFTRESNANHCVLTIDLTRPDNDPTRSNIDLIHTHTHTHTHISGIAYHSD
jgi:hypothetical protein